MKYMFNVCEINVIKYNSIECQVIGFFIEVSSKILISQKELNYFQMIINMSSK